MLAAPLREIRRSHPVLGALPLAVLEAILLVEGPVGSSAAVARFLGLRNRYSLQRLLKREGLPSLRRLSSWVLVLSWVQAAQRDGSSLSRLAARSHRYPSSCYRLIHEVTGLKWRQVLRLGPEWVQERLLQECEVTARH